jgi:hypothetical protein
VLFLLISAGWGSPGGIEEMVAMRWQSTIEATIGAWQGPLCAVARFRFEEENISRD